MKKIAIAGFGVEGRSTYQFFADQEGAELTILDGNTNVLVPEGAKAILGEGYLDDLSEFDEVYRTPGIPWLHPGFVAARSAGVKVTSQLEYFLRHVPCPVVGITGTKGKTTTALMLAHVLREACKPVHVAGNMGVPMLDLLASGDIKQDHTVVLELSSFQLQGLEVSPHIAVVLEVFQDHMDLHKSLGEYTDAKASIVDFQHEDDVKIVVDKGDFARRYIRAGAGQLELITAGRVTEIFEELTYEPRAQELQYGVSAVVLAAKQLGVELFQIDHALSTFAGVPYRMERVGQRMGLTFWNDSSSTTPESVLVALHSFTEPIALIVGGAEKHADFSILYDEMSRADCLSDIIVVGQACGQRMYDEMLQKELELQKTITHIPSYEQLKEALLDLSDDIKHVVLSPGCASFDEFKDYKARGDFFSALAS